jgi:hypothetical protein
MYQRRTLKFLNTLPALIAVAMLTASNVASAAGATQVFSYPNGFAGTSGAIRTAWEAGMSGSAINLTNISTEHQAGAAWYTTPQNITAFTTDFTFQLAVGVGSSGISTQGITFCVQNSNSTTDPGAFGTNAGADANLMGYGTYSFQTPMANSIAVKFDLSGGNGQNQFPAGRTPSTTGLYINGGPAGGLVPEIDLNPSGVNLHSGDIMAAHIVYDGSILTMTLRDTATNAQFRQSWPINIPSIMGGNTAYVGFTGGTLPVVSQKILTWSFSTGYAPRLSAPSFSVAAGSYPSAQSVSLTGPAGSTIYYTTNGRQPTSSSSKYTGPIEVSSSEVVQAIASQSGSTDSSVAVANYGIAPAGTPLVNFPNGFANASNLVTANGSAQFNGSAIQLTDATKFMEAGSAWYVVPVNVQSFTTNFSIQMLNAKANGMTFAIQNQPPASSDKSFLDVSGGPNAVANNSGGLGYSGSTNGSGGALSGLLTSVAVKFDLTSNTTGLLKDGASASTSNVTIAGVNLNSGNPLSVTFAYDGTTLKMTITDTKTKGSFSQNWAIDIPTTVGGNTAYVGFTGGTGFSNAIQDLLSWTFSSSTATAAAAPATVPAPPTNLRVQ